MPVASRRTPFLRIGSIIASVTLAGCAVRTAPSPALSGEWLDATAALDPARTPVYPGNTPITFPFALDMQRGDALSLSSLTMGAHSGTHVDAPMHFIKTGIPVDQVALPALLGPVRVLEIADGVHAIDAAELARHSWRGVERIFFRTASARRGWMSSATFHEDFAYLAPDAATLLVEAGVVLVGFDYLSAERYGAPEPLTHRLLLGAGIPIVEGLALDHVPAGDYDVIVLPLRVMGREGAPARAILRSRAHRRAR